MTIDPLQITHHPCAASLMSCSAGSMPEAFAAVMASHLAMCPDCRDNLMVLDDVGIALFNGMRPEPLSSELVGTTITDKPTTQKTVKATAKTKAPQRKPGGAHQNEGDVPAPLRPHVGKDLNQAPWRWLGPGLWQCRIPLATRTRASLRLLKVAPGRHLPAHGHLGQEMTLVLRGAYSDGAVTYHEGDVASFDHDVEHQPIADDTLGCICLVAITGRLSFKSRLARLIQPFTGM